MKRNLLGKLSKFFIDQFSMAVLLMVLILSMGTIAYVTLPKESLPEIILPTLTVRGIYPGASPEEVERLLVDQIEDALTAIDGIDEMTSESQYGLGLVIINFVEGTEIEIKKLEVDNKIGSLDLPKGVQSVESDVFKTSEIPLMNISVSSQGGILELTAIGETLEKSLEQLPLIEDVKLYGGVTEEVHVVINHLKMIEYGITFNDIRNALSSVNLEVPVGDLELNGLRYNLKVDERFDSLESIENILVPTANGTTVFIRDIGTVIMSTEEIKQRNQTYAAKQLAPSILLEVIRKADSDVLSASQQVRERVEMERGLAFPTDVTIHYSNDLSENVEEDLSSILGSAFSGLIVVVLVLYLFVGLKEAVIVSFSIPLSLFATTALLPYFDISFNTFVVLGLIVALGLLVDNSIIVMENIVRIRSLKYSIAEAADIGTNQVALPILAATLTTLAAFFPLAILPGTLGDFVSIIPITIMITLVMSLLVSIMITPTLSVRFLSLSEYSIRNKQVGRLFAALITSALGFYAFANNGQQVVLGLVAAFIFGILTLIRFSKKESFSEGSKWVVRYKKIIRSVLGKRSKRIGVFIIGVSLMLASFGLFQTGLLKVAFFPQSEPTNLTIVVEAPGGVTLNDTANVVAKIEKMLIGIESVDFFNTSVGGDELNKAQLLVSFKKDSAISGFEMRREIEAGLKNIAGIETFIQTISQGPPIGRPISIKIIGESIEETRQVSEAYAALLKEITGVYNVESSTKMGVPQLQIDINERKAQTYDLTVQSITSQIRGQIEGITATTYQRNRDAIDVVIKKSETAITERREVENLYISTPKGIMIPVSNIAMIKEIEGLSGIKHEQGKRVSFVEADLRQGYNITEVIDEFNERRKAIVISNDVRIQIGGDIEGIQDSFIDLFRSMLLAVFLVFIILTIQFRSLAQPLVILFTVPMAVTGVLWGLTLTQNDFGFYAFMALVALVGIAVNDAIVLIDYTNLLRKEGQTLIESVVQAGATRFNPVLATTMTTICGVLPLAFRNIYYAQFSFSLIFGLLITTILTLLFIPILYYSFEKIKERHKGGGFYEK